MVMAKKKDLFSIYKAPFGAVIYADDMNLLLEAAKSLGVGEVFANTSPTKTHDWVLVIKNNPALEAGLASARLDAQTGEPIYWFSF